MRFAALALLLCAPQADPTKFEPLFSLEGHQGAVTKIRFAGRTLLTLGVDGLRAWDFDKLVVVASIPGAFTFDIDPSGAIVAVGTKSQPKSILFCDVPSLKQRRKLDFDVEVGLFQWVSSVKMLLGSTVPRLIDPKDGRTDPQGFKDVILTRAIIGKDFVAVPGAGETRLYGKMGELRKPIPWEGVTLETGIFDASSKYFIGVSEGRVRTWLLDERKELFTAKEHAGAVIALAISGKWLASAGTDKTVRVYDLSSKKATAKIDAGAGITGITFTPDGRLAVACEDRSVRLFTHDKGEPSADLGMPFDFECVAAGMDRFYFGDLRGAVRSFEPATMKLGAAFRAHQGNVTAILCGKEMIVTAGSDQSLAVWGLDGKAISATQLTTPDPRSVRLASDGKTLYVAVNNTVMAWTIGAAAAKLVYTDKQGVIGTFDVSPDGKSLAVVDQATVHMVDVETGKDLATAPKLNPAKMGQSMYLKKGLFVFRKEEHVAVELDEKLAEVGRLVCEAGGQPVALSGPFALHTSGKFATIAGEQVVLWDLEGGKVAGTIALKEKVRAMAFTGDGKFLAVVTMSGNAVICGVKPPAAEK
jgi:WD40 repeat protein